VDFNWHDMPHVHSKDDNNSNKDNNNNINNKYDDNNGNDSNSNSKEASQPDTHPEDIALPPARVARGNTSSLVRYFTISFLQLNALLT
jgi:hypothetical protein